MKILKEGKPWSAEVACQSCNATLLVEQKDLYKLYKSVPDSWLGTTITGYRKEFTAWACDCPICRTRIWIGPELNKPKEKRGAKS